MKKIAVIFDFILIAICCLTIVQTVKQTFSPVFFQSFPLLGPLSGTILFPIRVLMYALMDDLSENHRRIFKTDLVIQIITFGFHVLVTRFSYIAYLSIYLFSHGQN